MGDNLMQLRLFTYFSGDSRSNPQVSQINTNENEQHQTDSTADSDVGYVSHHQGAAAVSDNCGQAQIKNGQIVLLDHIYRRHVKPKKQHEIQRLSHVSVTMVIGEVQMPKFKESLP